MNRRPFWQPFWIDGQKRRLSEKKISNEYLIDICELVSSGGGWPGFLNSKKGRRHDKSPIHYIFQEAYDRGVLRPDILFNWNRWAEFHFGYTDIKPRIRVTRGGEYVRLKDLTE